MPESGKGRRAFISAVAVVGVGTSQLGSASAGSCSRPISDESDSDFGSDDSKRAAKDTVSKSNSSSSTSSSTTTLDSISETLDVPGLDEALEVANLDSGNEGPTSFVVGGLHGDEEAGYNAAEEILEWKPKSGRLVVLPRANPEAIENDSREYSEGNLNRQFSPSGTPDHPLAEAIWGIVAETNPDTVISLHESNGIYSEGSGVGQGVFRSPTDTATAAARAGIKRANRTIRSRDLKFTLGNITPPGNDTSGLLTEKSTYDANIPSFIIETYEETPLAARKKWHKLIARGILAHVGNY